MIYILGFILFVIVVFPCYSMITTAIQDKKRAKKKAEAEALYKQKVKEQKLEREKECAEYIEKIRKTEEYKLVYNRICDYILENASKIKYKGKLYCEITHLYLRFSESAPHSYFRFEDFTFSRPELIGKALKKDISLKFSEKQFKFENKTERINDDYSYCLIVYVDNGDMKVI